MKVYEIYHNLYQRGRTNKLPEATKREAAEALGLRAVFAMCPNPDDSWIGLGRVSTMICLPFSDGKDVPLEIHNIVEHAAMLHALGDPILVYCNAGRNRSSLFNALLLMDLKGWSAEEAIAHMRMVRPNALANPTHEEYLLKWGMKRR